MMAVMRIRAHALSGCDILIFHLRTFIMQTHTLITLHAAPRVQVGDMIDDKLTAAQLTVMFTRVNAMSAETGADDDAQELDVNEFIEVLGRVCNQRIPVEARGGEPFEFTWQSFLHFIFLPTYKKAIKKGKHKQMGKIK